MASLLFQVSLLVLLFHGASAVTHEVGDGFGWSVPGNDSFYENWAAGKTFMVGDILQFSWVGTHDVVNVSQADFDACTKPTENLLTNTPARVTLQTEGMHCYICTIGMHCENGQKVGVNVTGNSSMSPSPPSDAGKSPSPSVPSAVEIGISTAVAAAALVGVLLV